MGLYRIQYTPLAAEDINEIDVYISETLCNPDAAEKLLTKMEQQIRRLQQYPHLGYIVDDPYLASRGYRKLIVDNYLVFHLVDDANEVIIIMRVLYGTREYRDLL